MEIKDLKNYVPFINDQQEEQLSHLAKLFPEWNEQINLISRKDIQHLINRHILHSLFLANIIQFNEASKIFDLGTGGGFPGLPLAILFPDVSFTLVDARAKKIKVVKALAKELQLDNVTAMHERAEDHVGKYDFIVTRAVAKIHVLYEWSKKLIKDQHRNMMPNGMFAWKGSDYRNEPHYKKYRSLIDEYPLQDFCEDEYYEEKFIIYLPY